MLNVDTNTDKYALISIYTLEINFIFIFIIMCNNCIYQQKSCTCLLFVN